MKQNRMIRAITTSAVVGMVIALCALVGARSYPWVFAAFGAGWVVVSAIYIWNARRSEQ